jgi:hypothetical protein
MKERKVQIGEQTYTVREIDGFWEIKVGPSWHSLGWFIENKCTKDDLKSLVWVGFFLALQ